MRASCTYYVLDIACCRRMSTRPVLELGSPSSGQLQKLPTTVSSPSNRMSGHSVSCLQNLSHMVEYLIQVSVTSVTCAVKLSVIQRVHQVPLGFLVNIPPLDFFMSRALFSCHQFPELLYTYIPTKLHLNLLY